MMNKKMNKKYYDSFGGDTTVVLKEVGADNFEEIVGLKRESVRFVGSPEYVLAEAYIYRSDSTAYGIYSGDEPVGLAVIRDRPEDGYPYSFTGLFIADGHQKKGLGQAAVEAILAKLRADGLRDEVEIQVHEKNEPALKIYRRCGFEEVRRAGWNPEFLVMRAKIK